jgi:hypothetical protein
MVSGNSRNFVTLSTKSGRKTITNVPKIAPPIERSPPITAAVISKSERSVG